MKITQEKLPASQIGLEIEVPADKSKSIYEKTLKELAKTANIPGFRKGKVPRPILLQRLGHERIKATVLDELIQNSLREAIEQESINSIGNLQLKSDFEELVNQYQPGEVITFQATVDVPPEVNVTTYQGLSVKAEEVLYDAEKVDKILDERRHRLATLVPIEDRPAQMGDVAIVDFEGRKPSAKEGEVGELIEGTLAEEAEVELSEGKFIPGFIEGIVGMNLGETKTLNLSFPDDYFQKDIAGQPVVFSVTLKDLKEKELPELDDDFAQEISEFETLAELKESLEKQYRDQAENDTKDNIDSAIITELIKHNSMELPETLIDEEIQKLLVQTANQLQNSGININKLFTREMVGEMRKTARPEAIKNLQTDLIIGKIAEQESVTVSEVEITEKVEEIEENFKNQDFDADKLYEYVKSDLIEEKTLAWLRENNQVELVPAGSLTESEATEEQSNSPEEQSDKTAT
jgi:trigger factor